MNEILSAVIENLESIGIGALLFLGAYVSNIGLGVWKNVKIEGYDFDWNKILSSIVKFAVLAVSIGLMAVVMSIIPYYIGFVGIEVEEATLQAIDSLIIIGAFLTATIRYIMDGVGKIKVILGVQQ